jgi:uncharacterized protein YciI
MMFVWMGFLKPTADPIPQAVQQRTIDFLSQPYIPIHAAGPLRDPSGMRAGMMMIFEVEDWDKARTFVAGSPYLEAGLYEEHHLFEYMSEVGSL